MPNSPTIRQQIEAALKPIEDQARLTRSAQSADITIVTGNNSVLVTTRIDVYLRHKKVFGKRMLGYHGHLIGKCAVLESKIVKAGEGTFPAWSTLGLIELERRSTFIKWFADSVAAAGRLLREDAANAQ